VTDPDEHVEPVEPPDPVDPVADEEDHDESSVPGPEEPRRYPSTIGGACYLGILAGAVVALGIIVGGDWRVGVRVLAGCLAVAGALRLVLPERDAGMLAVRHRSFDVLVFAAVAATLWWLAGSIPDQPGV
jgi:hypothetical protein